MTTAGLQGGGHDECAACRMLLLACVLAACDDTEGAAPSSAARAAQDCAPVPAPRWVLRDKDGQRIKAMVEPRCGEWSSAPSMSRCDPLDFASAGQLPCVRVIDHEGRFVNLQYELSSGQIAPCQGGTYADPSAEWWQIKPLIYTEAGCAGERYARLADYIFIQDEFTRAREVYFAQGDIWYASEFGCIQDVPYWVHSIVDDECIGPYPPQVWACPLQPVPAWVKDLLPNPPYSLAVEYE